MSDEYELDDSEYRDDADRAYAELLERIGESAPQPRLGPTRRAVELLGDPQRSYPVIHVTGTNGKPDDRIHPPGVRTPHGARDEPAPRAPQ
jgi:dihydrofolate synthase/folylpolyglutamate synthase